MRNRSSLFLSLLLICSVVGCRSKPAEEKPSEAAATSGSSSPVSPWKIELRLTPEKPRMIKPVTFTVHIVDGNGKTVDNAQVRGSLLMKVMDMGKNELKLEPKGNGDYEGTLKEMDMSGPWELAVDASQGDFHAQKSFEIVIYD